MHRVFLFLFLFLSLFGDQRGSSYPYISGDSFRAFADHVFDEVYRSFNPKKVKDGDVIFLKTDWDYLERFFKQYHPKIKARYAIITHNSDHSCPGPFKEMLNSNKVLAWFGQNVEGCTHPKLYNIPIGIANRCWKHGEIERLDQFSHLKQNEDRDYFCYMNFEIGTYPKGRTKVYNLFKKRSWCKKALNISQEQYLIDLSNSKFVLSPRGNGLDCHRTWEALLMGAIPIVETSSLDPLYVDMPVVIVKDFEEVTKGFLEEKFNQMQNQSYNCEKVFVQYWFDFIRMQISKKME